jgi:hypothetical protein
VVKLAQRELPPELFHDLCKQRRFLAVLISRLNDSGPSLIVIDKYFSPDVCKDEQANSELLQTFTAVSKQTPIIVGRRTFNQSEWQEQPKSSELENKRPFSSACLVMAPALDFAALTKSDQFLSGATRLNADVRKIPLEWLTYPVNFDGQPAPIPSLAFAAVQARDPGIVQTDTIRRYLANGHHPLTSFLEPNDIPEVSAANVLCDSPYAGQFQLKPCEVDQRLLRFLKGRVVVIGEDSELDRHATGTRLGTVPGVLLQANYIESLLDDRYFRPTSNSFVLGAAIFWVLLIELLFSQTKSPEAAIALCAILVGISLGFCWVLLAATGILTFGGVSGTPILAVSKYFDARKERLTK